MKFFVHSQSETWHKNIDAEIGCEFPCLADGSVNPHFPWASIKGHTESLLKKKGISSPEEDENRLIGLICRHGNTVNALAACASGLSRKAVRACLTGDYGRLPGLHDEIVTYLRAIIAIHHMNPAAVTSIDAGLAKSLLPLCGLDSTAASQTLQIVTKLWISGVPSDSLVQDEIEVITQTACKQFTTQLRTMVCEDLWSEVAKAASWISMLAEIMTRSPSENKLNRILNKEFPDWRAWAAWRPNVIRFKLWDRLTAEQRTSLHCVLPLEGPDFQCQLHQTLGNHLDSCNADMASVLLDSTIRFPQDADVIGRCHTLRYFMDKIGDAIAGGPADIELLLHIAGEVVTESKLKLFDAVHNTWMPSISAGILELLQLKPEVKKVLPLLTHLGAPNTEGIIHMIDRQLIDVVTSGFKEIRQSMLSRLLDEAPLGTEGLRMIMELQEFGQAQRDAPWFMEMLKPNHRGLIKNWLTAKDANAWYTLRELARAYPSKTLHSILDRYFVHHFIKPTPQQYGFQVVETLIDLWRRPSIAASKTRCRLSLLIASGSAVDAAFRCQCIAQLSMLPDDFTEKLLVIIEMCADQPVRAITDLTQLLSSGLGVDVINCWQVVLVRLIEQQDQLFLRKLLDALSTDAWLSLLRGFRTIFLDDPELENAHSHPLLQPSLRAWGEFLDRHVRTIQKFESTMGKTPALSCILTGGEESACLTVLKILETLDLPFIGKPSSQNLTYEIVARLTAEGSNAEVILKTVICLRSMSFDGHDICERMLECHENPLPPTADVILAAALHSDELADGDKANLKVVAEALDIRLTNSNLPSDGSVELTDEYLNEEIEELFKEAKRLESLRLAFKSLDPYGMHELLSNLGIEDTSPLDDMLADIPSDIVDVVERLSDSEVEVQLPLTQLTAFTRHAMGASNAKNLMLRLQMNETGIGFCMHFDDALKAAPANAVHLPFFVSKDLSCLDSYICDARATPALVHLSCLLYRQLRAHSASLVEVQRFMSTSIANLFQTCIVCGASHTARLCRSSPCALPDCQLTFSKSRLEVVLADLRQDPAAVDLLIAGVYAASMAGKFDILPGHPVKLTTAVKQSLNSLPPLSKLQTAQDLEMEINRLQNGSRDLLIWTMTAFRGYLVSATGSLKIPSLPGAHQFFLANTNPEKERQFADLINSGASRRVFFHGTTFDRLYSILCQGLKEMSGTSLQRNGAHYGNGIYMAEEPSTAWPYSQTYSKGWKNSQFSNFRVLLGCEYVGTATAASNSHGIFVIKDAARLMVRYVFLIPPHQSVPVARHLVPAMESVFANLRAGTI